MIDDNNAEHGRLFGYHAGLMIGESGRSDSMIYDPSGSYDPCWKKKNCPARSAQRIFLMNSGRLSQKIR